MRTEAAMQGVDTRSMRGKQLQIAAVACMQSKAAEEATSSKKLPDSQILAHSSAHLRPQVREIESHMPPHAHLLQSHALLHDSAA